MIAAVLLIKDVVLRREGPAGEHFVRHVDALAFHRVVGADGMIDEIASFVKVVILYKLFDEIDVLFDLKIAVGAVIPAGTAHGDKGADIVGIVAELQPGCHGAEGKAAEGAVITGCFQVLR